MHILGSLSLSYQKKGLMVLAMSAPANSPFGMTTTKILKDAFLWHMPQMSQLRMGKVSIVATIRRPEVLSCSSLTF